MLSKYSETHEAFFGASANEIIGSINKQYDNVYSYLDLQSENKRLAHENALYKNHLLAYHSAAQVSKLTFIDTLHQDSTSSLQSYSYLPARIVSNNVNVQNNMLTLALGSNQGVYKGMGVAGPDGIVGEVIEVSANFCRAMSLLNRKTNISAMLKKTNTTGNIEWDGTDAAYVTLKNIPRSAKVLKGDTVVTSNYSSIFPPNLLVGTISNISNETSTNFYVLKIKTSTNFYSLQYGYLINNKAYNEQNRLEHTKLKIND